MSKKDEIGKDKSSFSMIFSSVSISKSVNNNQENTKLFIFLWGKVHQGKTNILF